MPSETIKERLVRMEVKQDNLLLQFTNHLKHHQLFAKVLLGAVLSLTGSLIVMLIKK